MNSARQEAKQPTVATEMTAVVHTIGIDQPLATAHKMMQEFHLRHLPVLSGGKLVGVLSQRDLYFLEGLKGVQIDKDKVEDAMSSDVYSVEPEAPLLDVVTHMWEQKIGCAVALKRDKVVGIFTTTDSLRMLTTMLKHGGATAT